MKLKLKHPIIIEGEVVTECEIVQVGVDVKTPVVVMHWYGIDVVVNHSFWSINCWHTDNRDIKGKLLIPCDDVRVTLFDKKLRHFVYDEAGVFTCTTKDEHTFHIGYDEVIEDDD